MTHWTRRRVPWPAGTTFSPLPVCPDCGRMVAPDAWDAHRDGHTLPPLPEPTEEELDAQIPPLPHPEQLMPTPLPAGTLPPGLVLADAHMEKTLWAVTGWRLRGDQLVPVLNATVPAYLPLEAVQMAVADVRVNPDPPGLLTELLWSVDRWEATS